MAAPFALPAGYWTTTSRNEFNERCVALHHEQDGWLSDHDCDAEAIFAAQDDVAERGAEREADYRAESDMLDAIFREVSRRYDADLPEADPRNRAVKMALAALDSISVPVSEDRVAA